MFELQREKFQRQFVEIRQLIENPDGNRFAQARGEAGKFLVHAVFVHGWFSATAGRHYNTKHLRCKRDCLCPVCPPN